MFEVAAKVNKYSPTRPPTSPRGTKGPIWRKCAEKMYGESKKYLVGDQAIKKLILKYSDHFIEHKSNCFMAGNTFYSITEIPPLSD